MSSVDDNEVTNQHREYKDFAIISREDFDTFAFRRELAFGYSYKVMCYFLCDRQEQIQIGLLESERERCCR